MTHLDRQDLEAILARLPSLTIGVLGDLFLDRYLDIDATLTEPSLETSLDAYQVVRVRSVPGAAGTVINNLLALGIGRVVPIALIGDDGEGYELRQALSASGRVDLDHLLIRPDRRTPTYTKPMLHFSGEPARELNRLDIKNRVPVNEADQTQLRNRLETLWPDLDGLIVLDQVSEPDCGVVTASVRALLAELGGLDPTTPVLADSREQIGSFTGVMVKPNERECLRATGGNDLAAGIRHLAERCGRTVFCTAGPDGIAVAAPDCEPTRVRAVPVRGPIDTVGAGDSTSAAIVSALAAGANPLTAAAFGTLVASITIQQLGTTGTASPDQLRARFDGVTT